MTFLLSHQVLHKCYLDIGEVLTLEKRFNNSRNFGLILCGPFAYKLGVSTGLEVIIGNLILNMTNVRYCSLQYADVRAIIIVSTLVQDELLVVLGQIRTFTSDCFTTVAQKRATSSFPTNLKICRNFSYNS